MWCSTTESRSSTTAPLERAAKIAPNSRDLCNVGYICSNNLIVQRFGLALD